MGGIKRKISMEKIEKKDSRSVAFSKRRTGLFNKVSEFCLLSDSQIAVLATPISSKSNVSFYSFGHSSVDSVVSAFLSDQCPPREDNGLGFWWEDESLAKSENPKELSDAVDSISKLLQNLKAAKDRRTHEDLEKKKDVVLRGTRRDFDQNQTLNLQSSSASFCIQDDPLVKNSEDDNQIVATEINNTLPGNLDVCNEEFDLDQIFDFVTNSQDILMNLEMDGVSTNQNMCSDLEVAMKPNELN